MANLFFLPFRPAYDNNLKAIPGAQIWFTLEGTNTPTATYEDEPLTTPHANPVVADGIGRFPTIYLDEGVSYRARVYDRDSTPGVDAPIEDYDPYAPGDIAAVGTIALSDDTGDADVGADMVGWRQAGTGATGRTVRDKLRDTVSVADFGAVGDGSTDDTAAVQAALDSLGAAGGVVTVPNDYRCALDGDLDIPPNVSLVGPHEFVDTPGNNTDAPYDQVGGALLVNSAATITIGSGATLNGLLIHRKGMVFPTPDTTGFAGTAITIGGDGATVSNCMILGFNKAIVCANVQRPRFLDLRIDCNNGLDISVCYDVPIIERVHCWPFATIESYAATLTVSKIKRSGTAFYLHDIADWAQVSHCFAFGYLKGFDLSSTNFITLLGCAVDGTYGTAGSDVTAGSRGYSIRGDSQDNTLIGCKAASQEIGVYIDTAAGQNTLCVGTFSGNGTNFGYLVNQGNASILGGGSKDVATAIGVNNAASLVSIDGFAFSSGLTKQIEAVTALNTSKLLIGTRNQFGSVAVGSGPISGTLAPESIASAATINIPAQGEAFQIAGTTNIGGVSRGWAGRQVTLFFSGVLTVANATANINSIRLSGGVNFTTTAGATLTLRHNGTQWYEIGRSA